MSWGERYLGRTWKYDHGEQCLSSGMCVEMLGNMCLCLCQCQQVA